MTHPELISFFKLVRELYGKLDLTEAQVKAWVSAIKQLRKDRLVRAMEICYAGESKRLTLDGLLKQYKLVAGDAQATKEDAEKVAERREEERKISEAHDARILANLEALDPEKLQAAKTRALRMLKTISGNDPAKWGRFTRSLVWANYETRLNDDAPVPEAKADVAAGD